MSYSIVIKTAESVINYIRALLLIQLNDQTNPYWFFNKENLRPDQSRIISPSLSYGYNICAIAEAKVVCDLNIFLTLHMLFKKKSPLAFFSPGLFRRLIEVPMNMEYKFCFKENIFTYTKIEYCKVIINKFEHYMASLTAKVASLKAMSVSWFRNINWSNKGVTQKINDIPLYRIFKLHLIKFRWYVHLFITFSFNANCM